MSNELQTQATQAAGAVSSMSDAEKAVVKSQFFPEGTTPDEMRYCMAVAEGLGLNPILKQIWFVPRRSKGADGQWRDKVEPMAGRDSFLTLAHRSGKFAGIKSWVEIKEGPSLNNGVWESKTDLYGIAEVKRKDTPEVFRAEVKYSEYVQTKGDGTTTKFWSDKPETMIKKVAESQVLRKAFNISGLYDESELDAPRERQVDVKVTDSPKIDAQRQEDAYKSAEARLLDCESIEQLEEVKKSLDKDEIGGKWAFVDQIYLGCIDDLSRARVAAVEPGINTEIEADGFPE